jgi:uncharacterized membrane protein YkvA (DUF1232 family)
MEARMKDQFNRFLDKYRKDDQQSFGGIIDNLRLIFRLLKDSRVNSLLKLLPVGALLYLIIPIDFLPINPLEDAVILWLGGTLFIELCPDDIVQEHRLALNRSQSGVEIADKKSSDVVDAEYKDVQ